MNYTIKSKLYSCPFPLPEGTLQGHSCNSIHSQLQLQIEERDRLHAPSRFGTRKNDSTH